VTVVLLELEGGALVGTVGGVVSAAAVSVARTTSRVAAL
jgi:hypothetical protein